MRRATSLFAPGALRVYQGLIWNIDFLFHLSVGEAAVKSSALQPPPHSKIKIEHTRAVGRRAAAMETTSSSRQGAATEQ